MERAYGLPDVMRHINAYIDDALGGNSSDVQWRPLTGKVNIWHKFRIQHHSSFRSRYLLKSQEVQAYPHSPECPCGAYDVILLGHLNVDGILGKGLSNIASLTFS